MRHRKMVADVEELIRGRHLGGQQLGRWLAVVRPLGMHKKRRVPLWVARKRVLVIVACAAAGVARWEQGEGTHMRDGRKLLLL